MLNEVLIVDGLPGCGKTLFTSIFSSLKRIEIQQYSTTLENLCALNYLNKISKDGLVSMIKIELDLLIYETMMSRNTNFRFDDLSSAWKIYGRNNGVKIYPNLLKVHRFFQYLISKFSPIQFGILNHYNTPNKTMC